MLDCFHLKWKEIFKLMPLDSMQTHYWPVFHSSISANTGIIDGHCQSGLMAQESFKLKVVTPLDVLFDQDIQNLVVTTTVGSCSHSCKGRNNFEK